MESEPFQKIAAKNGLPVALGEDTAGEPVAGDLSGLPHLLIAGATGSGKSVCTNTIVSSLLLTNGPDKLRMVMVDPKRVELTPFNGIPHLVTKVIVDTDEVLSVLRAMQNEMTRRYRLLEEIGARNLEAYNKKSSVHMPFLVIIIDELADLMMAASYEVEHSLVRLAQLGRAAGIHLIVATQRPSVKVVTGLLKANVPARIAFSVASQVDSRVILDTGGAEKLMGKGDMLLLNSDSPKPRRVQGTYVSDLEIEKLVEFWKKQSGPPVPEIPLDESYPPESGPDSEEEEDEDDVLDKARELAERYQNLSASVLQRRLQVGYPKAMKLMKQLEEEGLVSPAHART
ncbi:MAG: DNA translocase FtsK [Dehalococcoidia bacterium]|nr:DNA translocase FtsK [Dehalococcoidia bacterium]